MTEGTEQPASGRALDPASFGRVADDGTVYVRTPDGERVVGQVPDVPAAEALAFFTRRYEALELEVSLLERGSPPVRCPPTTPLRRSRR